ncbi:MAG: hypothetical protein AAGM38_07565 [Pseudomonadota bacterium]
MIALAVSSGAALSQEGADVDGVVETGERTVVSIGLEAIEEEAGLVAWCWRRAARWFSARARRVAAALSFGRKVQASGSR